MKEKILLITKALEEKDFSSLDTLLEEVFSSGNYSQELIDQYDEFLQEATLYAEFKEEEYREEALDIVHNS